MQNNIQKHPIIQYDIFSFLLLVLKLFINI